MGHRDLSIVDRLSPAEHWQNMLDFAELDMMSGGPDAHMVVSGHICRNESLIERLWYAGCYVNVYNAPTAEILFNQWSLYDVLDVSVEELTAWLTANWQNITTRRERKSVRIPHNMATFFKTYAEFVVSLPYSCYYDTTHKTAELRYEDFWEESQRRVKYLGRYSGFKLAEFITRYCDMPIQLPDIRPRGGWSPRGMLAILYPEYKAGLEGDDKPATLQLVNEIAADAYAIARKRIPELSMYEFEVFLCDYKQAYFGRRQYPGRSQDSELQYLRKIEDKWPNYQFKLLQARAEIFPHWALGEISGWSIVREELGTCLYEHGYLWSDCYFEYTKTTDLKAPILR
jgi:hypothetical protein